MKIIYLLLSITPSIIHVNIRRILGAKIGKKSKIKLGTIIFSKDIIIGKNVSIGPFSYINSKQLTIGDYSTIKSLSVISAREINLGKYVHISPLSIISGDHTANSYFKVGNHSRIFPFCWLETGEGIELGNHVGVGGHTLIFTHGVWPDFLKGGPVTYGPVKIKDNVWLPWRVFIMPNVEIGMNAIIGANSTVTNSIPANVIAAGTPAKIIKENALKKLTKDEKLLRAQKILDKYASHVNFKFNIHSTFEKNTLKLNKSLINIDTWDTLKKGDLVLLINKTISKSEQEHLISKEISFINHIDNKVKLLTKNKKITEFIPFLRRYGIRLDIIK